MKKELWLRLKNYHFDGLVPPHLLDHVTAAFGGADASTKAFANKLARKLGWKAPFAHQAIWEYKKFVYLGMVSDFPVTPPKVIDQVWHEHLLFSRAYREFCRDVLGRDFDHNPELVPSANQTSVFEAQYEKTLDLYAAEFDMEPPRAIWGTPKFSTAGRTRRTPLKKRDSQAVSSSSTDSTPLYMYFDGPSSDGGHGHSHGDMAEFGGGGGFTGGGGESSWGDSSHAPSDSGSSDGGSSDGGSSDGGGSSCGGGSGCSSGCGGGGE